MSSDEESEPEDEFWAAEVDVPHIEAADFDERGKWMTEAKKRAFREREVRRFLKEEAAQRCAAIPFRTGARHGGKHDVQAQWSPEEDTALLQVLPLHVLRPCWATVTQDLAELCPKTASRTLKSVRCRWNRLRDGRKNTDYNPYNVQGFAAWPPAGRARSCETRDC